MPASYESEANLQSKMTQPPVRAKMQSIEAARALAAFVVVLMHSANLMRVDHFSGHIGLGGFFEFGYVGVDFFFVLSGFIITYVHYADIGHPDRILSYLWRRFSRIYPIYWFILCLVIFIVAAGRIAIGKAADINIGVEDIANTIFLLQGSGEPKYVGVAWSLQFEVVFYVAFCLLLISARIGAVVFGAWALVVLAKALGLFQADLPLGLSNAHCLQFLMGVAVGMVARRVPLRAPLWLLLPVTLVFVGAVIFEVYGPFSRHGPEGRIALGLAAAAVLVTLVALEKNQSIYTPKWLAYMGSVSYSIYLGHIIFVNLTYSILLKIGMYHILPETIVMIVAIFFALSATTLIGRYVELPLVKILKDRR